MTDKPEFNVNQSASNPSTQMKESLFPLKSRSTHLKEIVERGAYDVVVIGGGCNGAGVLLDAATRGLRSLLIEQNDFASGASSKSTKLSHGGIRYLSQAFQLSWEGIRGRWQKLKLVQEAIVERSLMLANAPHHTDRMSFTIPSTSGFTTAYYYLGSLVYYLFYAISAPDVKVRFNLPYLINRLELKKTFKFISPKYISGVVYEDGVFNDSRLLLSALFTATQGNQIAMPERFVPANIINQAEFLRFIKNQQGTITGIVFKDILTNKQYEVGAKYVVNCTGAWADKIRKIDNPNISNRIRIVGGSHLTYSSGLLKDKMGMCLPTPDGRILLVVPWLNRMLAGTTQTDFQQPTQNPVPAEHQREFIRKVLFDTFDELNSARLLDSQVSQWAGLRPLVIQGNQQSKQISRTHVIERTPSGLFSLMGGKWTIFRRMGEDLVDEICKLERQNQNKEYGQSQTRYLPLWGYSGEQTKDKLIQKVGVRMGQHLYNHYGSYGQIIAEGNMKIAWGLTTISELQWIVKNQMVTCIEDVLIRRTRSAFIDSKFGCVTLIPIIANIMKRQWSLTQEAKEKLIREALNNLNKYDFN